MTSITITKPTGGDAGTVELPAEIFDVQTNVPLIHQVVVAQLAAARQGTHSTKTRAEVRGGGRKPYRQKGTGRARQGSIRAPQFAGGGIVHGPQPRDYSQRTPKKMKAAALRGALSDRARHGRIHCLSALVEGQTPSTQTAFAALSGLTERANLLVVIDRADEIGLKSLRNLADVHVLFVDQLNTYDVLCADDIVFTQVALTSFIEGRRVDAAATPVAETEAAPAAEAETETVVEASEPATLVDGGFGADSAAATEDGSAPEGFSVKGNKDSMKYHVEGSRWYDQTVAEVWFRSAEAAEAAGFAPAGGAAAQSADAGLDVGTDEEGTK
ncbi:50S ribosomal protein L4, sunset domain variant [Ornithinimicrobium cryptoxanthini]|uniref:Large ribosomal subunit protein uL4 n=1 Tax=Ornithinimicrobium cryptoxanthini TaxID=2934161 RepID=A0ABY4YKD9_9MICO|nr:50S ribosomal protein L4 [Ornithinimicrobium cryptoxanthini]USQ77016.1 50S ribosomal protein L4 [Ornithinimicrobium cryptoxanthini]